MTDTPGTPAWAAPPVATPDAAAKVAWWKKKLQIPVWATIVASVLAIGAIGGAAGTKKSDEKQTIVPLTATTTTDASATTTAPATTARPTTTVKATTTTAESTTTLAPTTTLPAPVIFTGRGDNVVDIGAGNSRYVIHGTHNGSRNFIVTALDTNLERVDGTFNEIGVYDGTVLLNIYGSASDVRYLQVEADGDWSLELLEVRQVPSVEGTFTGHGSAVLFYSGDGGIFTITHDGERNFIVRSITSESSEGVVNEIGVYSGRQPIAGPGIISIMADGNWTFTQD